MTVLRCLAAVAGIAVVTSTTFAQTAATPKEILAKVSDTQGVLAKLDAEMRELRGRRDSEVYKLKTWSSSNAEGRTVEWPMVASTVEMGFFNHDVVAKPEIEGVEVRCRFTANEQTENLKSQFPHGTEFTCAGRVGSIFPSSDKTVITISDARAIKAAGAAQPTPKYVSVESTLRTSKVPIDHARKALEAFKSACTPLFARHADDIVEIKVTVEDGWSPRAQELGWGAEISVEVVLRDRTQTFVDARAGGHHFWYILGGGPKPGFLIMKRVSQTACGLPVHDDQPDAFVTVPVLEALLPGRR